MTLHVLTYHRVDEATGPTSVRPDILAAQVDALLERGFLLTRLSEGLRRFVMGEPGRLAALTFDDAYTSVFAAARPLLEERGVPATVFAVAGFVGRDNRWPSQPADVSAAGLMSWEELGALARAGWEIGAHGSAHADLTRTDEAELARELASGERIAERLGLPVQAFAYPYGRHDARVRGAARAAGYAWAVTTELRAVPAGVDPVAVPRVDAWYLQPATRAGALGTPLAEAWLAARRAGRAARGWVVGRTPRTAAPPGRP